MCVDFMIILFPKKYTATIVKTEKRIKAISIATISFSVPAIDQAMAMDTITEATIEKSRSGMG